MNIRDEITKFAKESDKLALNWLFSKYHMSSQWGFVAKCHFVKYGENSYQVNRIWEPTSEGWILYKNNLKEA